METAVRTEGIEQPTGPLRAGPARRMRFGLSLKVLVIAATSTVRINSGGSAQSASGGSQTPTKPDPVKRDG
jgi:hypothetical protein